MPDQDLKTAILGGGCFWCTEAIFQEIRGVREITSGYSGGNAPGTPTYREVCSGRTGHAEVVRLRFDANEIPYEDLLRIFMATHDPTTLNRQGADVGTQYRSVIFYQDEAQKHAAERIVKEMAEYYSDPIVTEIRPAETFYEAEAYHQDYYRRNPEQGYCNYVITPKLAKLRQKFSAKLASSQS